MACQALCRCDGISPVCGSFGPEDPQYGSGDEMTLKVEGVVNRTVHAEEALGRSSRLGEPTVSTTAGASAVFGDTPEWAMWTMVGLLVVIMLLPMLKR